MSSDEDAPLAVFVAEFQEDLVSAFESFTGERPVLEPSWLDTAGKDAISIRLAQEKGEPGVVALRAKGKEEALRVLVDVFGMPEPEGWVCPQGDPKKLARN